MAKIKQIILIILITYNFSGKAQQLIVGAERTNQYIPLIKNKNIAIIGNHTSMIKNKHLVDSLLKLNIKIIKILTPEHGFRGTADAGEEIKDQIDNKTGIPVLSLYGKNKKPTNNQLKDIDILLFDIQDVGVRFYTYISTLHYVMEVAAEMNIQLVVLDRPNPNGHYIDGPLLDKNFKSFVGMHPVPIVYGMTIGEYAQMINGEKWIQKKCKLTVIKMKGYTHSQQYSLQIKPSPNLPNERSINLYPSLCLFEGTNVSIGRGTKFPFQHFGAPYLNNYKYEFTPKSNKGSKSPKHENKKCYGVDLREHSNYLKNLNINWLIETYQMCPEKDSFFNTFFDKLAGTNKLREQIISGKSAQEIKKSWQKDLTNFEKIRIKYTIY